LTNEVHLFLQHIVCGLLLCFRQVHNRLSVVFYCPLYGPTESAFPAQTDQGLLRIQHNPPVILLFNKVEPVGGIHHIRTGQHRREPELSRGVHDRLEIITVQTGTLVKIERYPDIRITQQTAISAEESAAISEDLKQQARQLQSVVGELVGLVQGASRAAGDAALERGACAADGEDSDGQECRAVEGAAPPAQC